MSELKQKTISSLIWKFLERSGASFVQLVVQIVMARLLAPDDFGVLAIMLVFISVGNVIVQSGLSTSLVQSEDAERIDFSTVFWMSLAISLALYTLIFLGCPFIADFYNDDRLIWPLRTISLILVINALNSVQVSQAQRNLEYKKIFKATVVSVVLSGALGVTCACFGLGIWALVIQQVTYQFINCVVLSLQITWHPTLEFSVPSAKRHFSYGWKLLLSGLLNTAYNGLSDLIIGKQFSSVDLGFVSQGKKYPMTLGTILDGTIQSVMLSAVSRVQDDIAYVKRLVRRALRTSTYAIVPTMVLFAVVAKPVVLLVLGEQWAPCVPFLQMYCFVYALLPIHTSNLQALNGMGRSDLFLKLEIIKKIYGVLLIVLGAFVFQNVYILVGGYMVSGVISTFVNAWPNKRVIGYSYFEQIRDICPAFLLSAVAGCASILVGAWLGNDLYIAMIILQSATMIIVYLGLSRLLKIEAFGYLVETTKELIASKRSAQ